MFLIVKMEMDYQCLLLFVVKLGYKPESHCRKQNKALLEFVKHANQQPMKIVQEFVSSKKDLGEQGCDGQEQSNRLVLPA